MLLFLAAAEDVAAFVMFVWKRERSIEFEAVMAQSKSNLKFLDADGDPPDVKITSSPSELGGDPI